MRLLTILFLFFIPVWGVAQKWVAIDNDSHLIDRKTAQLASPPNRLSTDTSEIKTFLISNLANLKHQHAGLLLESAVESPKGWHYRFSQTLHGRRVFRGAVKLNVSDDGQILSLFDHTFQIPSVVDATFPDHDPYHGGLAVHYGEQGNGKLHRYELEETFFSHEGQLLPSIRLEVVETTDRYYELVLNTDVKVIYQNDLLAYGSPQDSLVTLWVFNPDPLTTANVNYGAPYVDAFDQDVLELNAERVPVQMNVTFENDTFFLRSAHVVIGEFSAPVTVPAFSLTPEFNHTRSEPEFEDVNAYYHINYFQQYIQSLGFTDIVNYPIAVDAHALNGSDNSNFNPGFSPPRLQFGEGGVDDAEDADVIIHEYGHAIMHSAAPGSNVGTERRALDEAIGDYFASSYSRFLSPNRWSDVFTWDGHNEFWAGRSTVSSDHYPEDLNNNIYTDADIWSATLMQIWGDIGREATDAIMIQAGYSFSDGMTMPQAALLFIQADTLLFGGTNFTPIRQRMFDRGLIPWNVGINDVNAEREAVNVYNTAGFASGNGPLRLRAGRAFEFKLYNGLGQLLRSEKTTDGVLDLGSEGLGSGVYILELTADGHRTAIKLVKH